MYELRPSDMQRRDAVRHTRGGSSEIKAVTAAAGAEQEQEQQDEEGGVEKRNAKEEVAEGTPGGREVGVELSQGRGRGEYDMNQQTPKWNINNVTMRLPSLQHGRPGSAEFVP